MSTTPTPTPETTAAPAAPAAPVQAPDAAALQAEVEALKGSLAEQQRAAEFWHNKATAAPAPAAAPAADEPEVDVLDLATRGGKAFENYLNTWAAKNGYVKQDKLDSTVNGKAAQMVREAAVIKKYPELDDHNSEMFKVTAGHYGDLVKAGVPQPIAMEMAAERAELQLIRAGKVKTPAEKAADVERDRLARIAAQAGDRGQRGLGDETDTELTPEQKHIALGIMRGATDDNGKPLTDEQIFEKYKARATKGVQRFGKAA